MESIVRRTLLFDFYGELLTAHQQQIYQDVVCNDLSCSEVASSMGISRQGVFDLVRRCDRQLEAYEEKLHLVEKFISIRAEVTKLRGALGEYVKKAGPHHPAGEAGAENTESSSLEEARELDLAIELCDKILEEI